MQFCTYKTSMSDGKSLSEFHNFFPHFVVHFWLFYHITYFVKLTVVHVCKIIANLNFLPIWANVKICFEFILETWMTLPYTWMFYLKLQILYTSRYFGTFPRYKYEDILYILLSKVNVSVYSPIVNVNASNPIITSCLQHLSLKFYYWNRSSLLICNFENINFIRQTR